MSKTRLPDGALGTEAFSTLSPRLCHVPHLSLLPSPTLSLCPMAFPVAALNKSTEGMTYHSRHVSSHNAGGPKSWISLSAPKLRCLQAASPPKALGPALPTRSGGPRCPVACGRRLTVVPASMGTPAFSSSTCTQPFLSSPLRGHRESPGFGSHPDTQGQSPPLEILNFISSVSPFSAIRRTLAHSWD